MTSPVPKPQARAHYTTGEGGRGRTGMARGEWMAHGRDVTKVFRFRPKKHRREKAESKEENDKTGMGGID